MKANTLKFITAYQTIDLVVSQEVYGKVARIAKEKEAAKLETVISTCGAKVTEEEFELISADLCCTWEDFQNCYIN